MKSIYLKKDGKKDNKKHINKKGNKNKKNFFSKINIKKYLLHKSSNKKIFLEFIRFKKSK